MRRIVIGAVTAAGIVGGSIAVAAVNPFGVAGAQDGGQAPATTAPADPADPGPGGAGRGRHGAPGRVLDETLDDLVAKGTITEEQADAVRDGVKARIGSAVGEGHGRGGRGGHEVGELFGTAAQAMGMTTDELKAELRAGKSIADVARARGVDPQTVIDAVVAAVGAKIDQAVADGKIPAERAEAAKAKVRERITEMVNNTGGAFKGHGRGHGRGHHGDDEGDAGDDGTTPPSTEAPSTEPPAGQEAPTTEAPSPTDAPAPTEAPAPTAPTGTTA